MPQIFELLQPLQSTGEVVEDHLPYIFCNEQNQLNTLDYLDIWKTNLSVDPARKKSVHIGFSVWFNLDIVATTQPDYAVILDFDPTVHGFLYPAICSALKDCESREEFASVLMKEVCKNPWLLSCQSYLQSRLDDTFTAPCGFLSNQTRYSYVRNFLLKDRLFLGGVI